MKITRTIIKKAAIAANLKAFDLQSIEKNRDMSSGRSWLRVRAWVYSKNLNANCDRTFDIPCTISSIAALAKELDPTPPREIQ